MTSIASVCVYCGSAVGRPPNHADAARHLGAELAARRIRLIYGGGRLGMMGLVADAAIAGGGKVTGVIPDHLRLREQAHPGVDEMIVVDDMHSRKRRMLELADGIVIMPGGLGTLDEAFETITWKQLDLHDKPIVLANIDAYWDPFQHLVDAAADAGYVRGDHRHLFSVADSVDAVFTAFESAPKPRTAPDPERL